MRTVKLKSSEIDPVVLTARALKHLVDGYNYWEMREKKGKKHYFPKREVAEIINRGKSRHKTINNALYLQHCAGQITLGFRSSAFTRKCLLMLEVDSDNQNAINQTFVNLQNEFEFKLNVEYSSTFKTLSHSYVLIHKGWKSIKEFKNYIIKLQNYLNAKCAEAGCFIEFKGLPNEYFWRNKEIIAITEGNVAKFPRDNNFHNFIEDQQIDAKLQKELDQRIANFVPTKIVESQGSINNEVISQSRFQKEFKRVHNFINQVLKFREDSKVNIDCNTFKGVVSKDTLALMIYSAIKSIEKQSCLEMKDAPQNLSDAAKIEYLQDCHGAVSYSMIQKRYSLVKEARELHYAESLQEVDSMSLNRTAKLIRYVMKLLIKTGLVANTAKQRFVGVGNKGNRGKRYAVKTNPLNSNVVCSGLVRPEQAEMPEAVIPAEDLILEGIREDIHPYGGDNTTCNSGILRDENCLEQSHSLSHIWAGRSPSPCSKLSPDSAEQYEPTFESIQDAVRYVSDAPVINPSAPKWLEMTPRPVITPEVDTLGITQDEKPIAQNTSLSVEEVNALDNLIDDFLSTGGLLL